MIIPKYSKIPAKIKGVFFYLRLHYLFGGLSNTFIFLGNISRLSKWISDHKNVGYTTFYRFKFNYNDRFKLHEHIIKTEKLQEINYLEFGVFDGGSFLWWADKVKASNTKFYGFDTFEGLPENWGAFKAGEMESGIPKTDDDRCVFVKGLFQQTLPGFLKAFDNSRRNVIMMDADLYTATLYTLTSLAPYLKKGDIILFDEFSVPTHEFMAYQDFINSYYLELEPIGVINNYYFIAFKIK